MKRHNGLRDMTTGSPAGHILYFALPLLAGSLLQPVSYTHLTLPTTTWV